MTSGAQLAQRLIVGVCDYAAANNPALVMSTYALGSCIGVVAYEPRLQVGGLLHYMLPQASIAPARATRHPAMFADTGVPLFLRALAGLGALPDGLRFLVTGGAAVLSGGDPFRIAERNVTAAFQLLAREGCTVTHRDTGAAHNRTVHLELGTGDVTVRHPQGLTRWTLADAG
jgi:chemotaxis protein CheD